MTEPPRWQVLTGDCLDLMAAMPDCSVDAIVTDPPYGLGFMGQDWDHGVPGEAFWREVLRVAKPGAHLLAFGGTRTWHRLAVAIEDAGWAIRDTICWVTAQGFPKSLDVSRAIDKVAGAVREVVGPRTYPDRGTRLDAWPGGPHGNDGWKRPGAPFGDERPDRQVTAPATPEAARWAGWGTALKPAFEPLALARKPLCGTVAENVLAHGTGGLNIDGCRIETTWQEPHRTAGSGQVGEHGIYGGGGRPLSPVQVARQERGENPRYDPAGRWPANLVLGCCCEGDEHEPDCPVRLLDEQTGERKGGSPLDGEEPSFISQSVYGYGSEHRTPFPGYADTGGASRFFFCAKASRAEREAGCDDLPATTAAEVTGREPDSPGLDSPRAGLRRDGVIRNGHPTVKPLALMRWLVRLVTPPGGLVLDPFCGSGSTGCAAVQEGMRFVGHELDAGHADIARARIAHWAEQPALPETLTQDEPATDPTPVQLTLWGDDDG